MSASADSRSIAYSAESSGRAGKIACHALRNQLVGENRVSFTIVVRNDTGGDADVFAFVPDALDLRHRTIVQSVVGPYADFSTNVELDFARYGGMPELRIELSGDDTDIALIVPSTTTRSEALSATPHRIAVATVTGSSSASNSSSPAVPAPPAVRPAGILAYSQLQSYRPWPHDDPPVSLTRDLAVRRDGPRSPAVLPILTLFGALMAAVGVAVFRPQVSRLDVPRQAVATKPIPIAYRATGLGTVSFRVVAPDAATVESGTLAPGSGSFTLTLPRARDEQAYLVRVSVAGPLGSALAEEYVRIPAALAHVVVVPPPPPRALPAPQIRSLALDRAMLDGGATLNVYYDVDASNGSISLVDGAAQIAYGTAALSPSGHTAFVLPVVQTPRFLSVVLKAQRGGVAIVSRVGVTATPQSSPTPQADASAGSGDESAAATPPAIVAPKTVRSGEAIQIGIRGGVPGLALVLSDNEGSQLARSDLDATQSNVTFAAPLVSVPTRVRLEATYPQGAGTETIVQTIVVVPR